MKTIAIDAMGGDFGPSVVIPASLKALKRFPQLKLILVGDERLVDQSVLDHGGELGDRLSIQHASEKVGADESPAKALRNKKDSSMRVAINLVHKKVADACVSSGNTGALMATARFVLKTLPGIDRPAIISPMPGRGKRVTYMLDLGANVDCTSLHLLQFAVMGSSLVSSIKNIENPRVALLNIGEESIKGNEQVKESALLIEESKHLNYIGFVEANDIFSGEADVVVCDGFVGNVTLKTSEGLARLIKYFIKEVFTETWWTRAIAIIALPVLKRLSKRLDPRCYNGASFLGLNGTVVKSHGSADELAFLSAIEVAMLQVDCGVPNRIRQQLADVFDEEAC